jgi:two-component system chemotaxis response regulator CheB
MIDTTSKDNYLALVIGVSAGGFNALCHLLPLLPERFPLAIIVLQHRGDNFTENEDDFLITHMQRMCRMPVKEAKQRESIEAGLIYIAPAKYHLLIEKERIFSLSLEPPVNFSIPSIDVLFNSASRCYKNQLIGLILTGANSDGSVGLKTIHDNGGLTLVQSPDTAEVATMPQAAINGHKVDYVLSLDDLAIFLQEIILGGTVSD